MTSEASGRTGVELGPLWGATLAEGRLVLRPRLPEGAHSMEASLVRVHRTLLDLAARRRPGRLVIRVAKRFGPDLGVDLAWGGPESIGAVMLDEHPLAGVSVRFLARHEHEAQFLLADGWREGR